MFPLHRNGNSSIVACIFVSARTRLAMRCLAMDVHVKISRTWNNMTRKESQINFYKAMTVPTLIYDPKYGIY
jgi:hypothetical protein